MRPNVVIVDTPERSIDLDLTPAIVSLTHVLRANPQLSALFQASGW